MGARTVHAVFYCVVSVRLHENQQCLILSQGSMDKCMFSCLLSEMKSSVEDKFLIFIMPFLGGRRSGEG